MAALCSACIHVSRMRFPSFGENAVERAQSEAARIIDMKHLGDFEVSGDTHAVPSDIDGFVDVGGGALQARGVHFLFRRVEKSFYAVCAEVQAARNFLDRSEE